MSRADELADFIARGTARPFVWGACDCALWACEWVAERQGVDPLAEFRWTYGTAEQARAIASSRGGLPVLMTVACAAVGLERAERPEAGDIGIVGTLLGPAVMIACGDGRWAGKSPRGVWFLKASPTLMWRV